MAENRPPGNRREHPTRFLSKWSFLGGRRRAGGRRPGEDVRAFVDLYSMRVWVVLTSFFFLSLLDAHFTLIHLMRGGEEGNVFVRGILELGQGSFLLFKQIGIGLGTALFCILKNHPNARLGVLLALVFYQALLAYHLLLFFNLIPGSVLP